MFTLLLTAALAVFYPLSAACAAVVGPAAGVAGVAVVGPDAGAACAGSTSDDYPFRDTALSEEERIDNLLSLMTVDEKVATMQGFGVPRLGVPDPGSTEAIHGIVRGGATTLPPLHRGGEPNHLPGMVNSTAFPQGYGLGETWDRGLLEEIGEVMAQEARYHSEYGERNCLVLWAPNADLGRDPRWGRTEECFGEDPYLVGELVASEVRGIQGPDPEHWRGASLMKHFLANSNEDGRSFTDSRFDEALFRDYYSYGFWKGVRDGGARSLMCAYNKYNGVPCSANEFIRGVLVDEWGMDGTLVNDGGALALLVSAHRWAPDMKHGAAICMEAGITRFLDRCAPAIREAIDEGLVSMEVVDRNVRHNLRTILRLGLMDPGAMDVYGHEGGPVGRDGKAPWEGAKNIALARRAAQESVVLLKNSPVEGGVPILPLDTMNVKKIAVFGNRAEEVLKDWYGALPTYWVSPLQGLCNAIGATEGMRPAEDDCSNVPGMLVARSGGVEIRFLKWDSDGAAQKLAAWADVAIVCVGNHPNTSPDWGRQTVQAPWACGGAPGEGREAVDRRSLELDTEDLVKVVRQVNPSTVVALISSFPYAINWCQENVGAIVHITQCGQELGNALADVLLGSYNPAGRTTQTWVRSILDLPNMLDYDIRHGRTYMYFRGKPLYAFGHGLSYTSFRYSRLKVSRVLRGICGKAAGAADGGVCDEAAGRVPGEVCGGAAGVAAGGVCCDAAGTSVDSVAGEVPGVVCGEAAGVAAGGCGCMADGKAVGGCAEQCCGKASAGRTEQCCEKGLRVSFRISNTGSRDGQEVPQLYLRFKGDDGAAMRLRGFDRVSVPAGCSVDVELFVPEADLQLWDCDEHAFRTRRGRCRVLVGAASDDIRLRRWVRL